MDRVRIDFRGMIDDREQIDKGLFIRIILVDRFVQSEWLMIVVTIIIFNSDDDRESVYLLH